MAHITDEAVALMEPIAAQLGFLDSLGEAATVSIAVSLKRIADALAPKDGQDVGSTLYYIEQRLGQVVCQ